MPGSGGLQAMLSLYMDDVTVFCNDNRSVTKIFWHCNHFGLASNSKANLVKSECVYLNWKDSKVNWGFIEKDCVNFRGLIWKKCVE